MKRGERCGRYAANAGRAGGGVILVAATPILAGCFAPGAPTGVELMVL